MREAKALASLRICADLPEPLLFADAISTIPTHVGPITDDVSLFFILNNLVQTKMSLKLTFLISI